MLSRKFFSNKIWKAARTFSECEAWLDLIQSARFEATVTIERIGGREIKYGRGQYPASIRFLAKKWSWSEKAVRSFLSKLVKEGMIATDNSQGMSVITLRKYDEYNSSGTAKGTTEGTDTQVEIKRLTEVVAQLAAQMGAHPGHTEGTKKNKEEKREEYNTIGGSNEPLPCGTSQPHEERVDYDRLVSFFNEETRGVFGTIRPPLSDTRKGMVNARIREHGKKAFFEMVKTACQSDFLKGQNKKGWRATFDWLIKPTNFEKVISGNFNNKQNEADSGSNTGGAGIDEAFLRNVAEGIARGNLERERRGE